MKVRVVLATALLAVLLSVPSESEAAFSLTPVLNQLGSTVNQLLTQPPPVQLHPIEVVPNDIPATIISLLAPRPIPVSGGPDVNGAFSLPFTEPTINGTTTTDKCVVVNDPARGAINVCKPAGATVVNLADGRQLYWDALEGTENVKFSIVTEFGQAATNDSTRVLDLRSGTPSWSVPNPFDGGANPNGDPGEPLIPPLSTHETYNDGALFGSHESFLPDGKLLVQGGTDYSLDPGVDGFPFGVSELAGLKSTRIFDPATDTFTQTGDTTYRRWYPTVIETGDGKYLDFSGVGKLLKPIYPDHLQDSLTNVKQVERYDPATGKWTLYGSSADRDLPLYPRMHLLPDGHVFYNAAGQDFNPFGQSLGELGWFELASFDPANGTWTNLGPSNVTTTLAPGFRGSTSSTMLPLKPDSTGQYTKASFLTAGGVLLPSPGSYFATAASSITTVDTAGGSEHVSQQLTGPLNQVRWFGSNVLLPTGQVIVFSGADRDEVVGPGVEFPMQQAELFDPATNNWRPIATAHNPRTYHNTAVLLASGQVLVGGHAPISTLYLNDTTLPGGFAPHDGRDPSFEIFNPPYMYWGPRPQIQATSATNVAPGQTITVTLGGGEPATDIDSVSLVRNTAITHLVDADQRTVMLPITSRSGSTLTVKAPPNSNIAPPGPYMLFVNKKATQGLIPSVAKQLMITP